MLKNKKINEESKKALKEFREKQIQTNIKLHIIVLSLIILIDICLIIFIFLYKSKIFEIKSKTKRNSSSLNREKYYIEDNKNNINHQLVNIFARNHNWNDRFSYIFETSEEVNMAKNAVVEYYSGLGRKLDKNNFVLLNRYISVIDGDTFSDLRERMQYSYQTFVLIESSNHTKFGFYFADIFLFHKRNIYDEDMCFIMSFKHEGIFKCKGKGNKFEIKDDDNGMIIIGEGDIIIKNNFSSNEKGGIINFPFKSFDLSNINTNIFTEITGDIEIKAIEIFIFNL